MPVLSSLAAALLLAAPTAPGPAASEARAFAEYEKLVPAERRLTPAQLRERLADPARAPIVVEMRGREEFEAGHIPDGRFAPKPHAILQLAPDRATEICLVTETERGAVYVAGVLRKYGYERVSVLKGGIDAWIAAGLPLQNKVVGDFVVEPAATAAAKR